MVVDGDVDVNGDGDERRNSGGARTDREAVLSFQKLDVYRCAIELLAVTAPISGAMPRGFSSLAEQLRRAALSVPLHIAEAAGRTTAVDAARHYAIARGSAMECAAIVDSLHVLSMVDPTELTQILELIGRIVSMLTRLCR